MGTFIQALYDEAKNDGWTIISMKNRLETGIRLMSSDAPTEQLTAAPARKEPAYADMAWGYPVAPSGWDQTGIIRKKPPFIT